MLYVAGTQNQSHKSHSSPAPKENCSGDEQICTHVHSKPNQTLLPELQNLKETNEQNQTTTKNQESYFKKNIVLKDREENAQKVQTECFFMAIGQSSVQVLASLPFTNDKLTEKEHSSPIVARKRQNCTLLCPIGIKSVWF